MCFTSQYKSNQMSDKPFKHKWTQPYNITGRYENINRLRLMLRGAEIVQRWDKLEPITDLTEAQELLKKFTKNP